MDDQKTVSKLGERIDNSALRDYAIKEHGKYWRSHEDKLHKLVSGVVAEVRELDGAADSFALPNDLAEAKRYKAVWAISGAGTYQQPITDSIGDSIYKDKTWAHNTDKKRIDHAIEVIREISFILAELSEEGKKSLTKEQAKDIIREFGPFLVYNGVSCQIDDLTSAIRSGELNYPEEKLFIPDGTNLCTLDQVMNLKFPDINFDNGDMIGVVTHSPHFPRLMRMVNKYKPFPRGTTIKAFPIKFNHFGNEIEFVDRELKGIIGYIDKGQAEFAPYPYNI